MTFLSGQHQSKEIFLVWNSNVILTSGVYTKYIQTQRRVYDNLTNIKLYNHICQVDYVIRKLLKAFDYMGNVITSLCNMYIHIHFHGFIVIYFRTFLHKMA